jgi:hypothetical protein
MEKEKLPIKFFAPREIDELRVEGAGNSEPPKWVLTNDELVNRSSELLAALNQFTDIMSNRVEHKSTVPFVFVAKMCDDSTAKSRRKDISSLFQTSDKSSIIGLADSDELIVKLDSVLQMKEISNRLKDYQRNSYAISCLETFWEFQPFVHMQEDEMTYKVKLIDFQDYEMNVAMQRLFERTLTARKIEYKKTSYANQFPVYKIINTSQAILDEFMGEGAYEMLFSIEPMPKYFVALDSIQGEETVDVQMPVVGQRYETLGILDNGIAPIAHLAPWMPEKRWSVYPESAINPTHGTFVSGVALYGDTCEKQDWVGHKGIRLFDATVFPDTAKEGLDEDDLIANIREAITASHEKVKIWNLSISITRPVCDTKFSDFAIALDDLQEQYNILICKSAGNCSDFASGLPKGRIHEGADSVRSLVVGSVAQEKGPYDFSEVGNPSPFSRIGPGPEFIIKPEVSHYGGNAGINKHGEIVTTGVKSFSSNGDMASGVGTSFSTPRIASLATGLYQELDEAFDPLLLKGLIVHSASYSKNLQIPVTERTKQLGFGVPKTVSEILYNDPYEATLILRDTLAKGEYIDIMDFPMPKSLIRNGYYTGQIIATLVYDPILDPTQGVEYCQSNVDVKYGSYDAKKDRDVSKRNILNPVGRQGAQNLFRETLYSKRLMRDSEGDFALRERLLIQYGDKYYPVKKYAIDLSELSEANKQNYATADKQWYLNLRGLFRNHTEQLALLEHFTPSQEICLIITIRDSERKSHIYDEVTQGLDAFNFWHSNIKISSDISVPI